MAVLGREDPGSWDLAGRCAASWFPSACTPLPGAARHLSATADSSIYRGSKAMPTLFGLERILLRGEHNLLNVLAACAIGLAAGLPVDRAAKPGWRVLAACRTVSNWSASGTGPRWYNDSIATAPERTIAAIRSFSEPLVLLLGGRDKNLPWEDAGRTGPPAGRPCGRLRRSRRKNSRRAWARRSRGSRPYSVTRCAGVQEAVQAAAQVAAPGSVVLFSPGGTSYDQFKDFEERGERFRQWVKQLS